MNVFISNMYICICIRSKCLQFKDRIEELIEATSKREQDRSSKPNGTEESLKRKTATVTVATQRTSTSSGNCMFFVAIHTLNTCHCYTALIPHCEWLSTYHPPYLLQYSYTTTYTSTSTAGNASIYGYWRDVKTVPRRRCSGIGRTKRVNARAIGTTS